MTSRHRRRGMTAGLLATGWVVGMVSAAVLGKWGAAAGKTWANGSGVFEDFGAGLGGIGAALAAQLGIGSIVAALVARLNAESGGGDTAAPGKSGGPRRLGQIASLVLAWGLVLFPLTLALGALLPTLAAVRARESKPDRALRVLEVLALLAAGATFAFGYFWAALPTPLEEHLLIGAVLALALAMPVARRFSGVAWCVFALVGLAIALAPPFPISPANRIRALVPTLALALAPLALGSSEVLRRGPVALWIGFELAVLYWPQTWVFAALPARQPIVAPPSVEVTVPAIRERLGVASDNRFLLRACDRRAWIAGTRERSHGLLRVADGALSAAQPFVVGNNGVLACEEDLLFTVGYGDGTLVGVSTTDLQFRERYHLGDGGGFMHVQLSRDRRTLFVNDEGQMGVVALTRGTGAARLLATGTNVRGFWVDEVGRRVFLADAGRVRAVSLDDGRDVATVDLRSSRPTHATWEKMRLVPGAESSDGSVAVLYASRYLSGRVARLDARSLTLLAQAEVGRGARDLVFDRAHDRLYVANYATGDVASLDGTTLARRWTAKVGRRVRQLEIDPVTSGVSGTSAAGWFLLRDRGPS